MKIWDDSKHYKEIYGIYTHEEYLYFNSTDQNLSIWKTAKEFTIIKHQYSLKFITASTQSIFYCESDPKVMFALLKDSIIRSSVPIG